MNNPQDSYLTAFNQKNEGNKPQGLSPPNTRLITFYLLKANNSGFLEPVRRAFSWCILALSMLPILA